MTRRVVVTGMGTVNPIAQNVPDYWRGLLAGHSGIAPITQFDTTAFKVHFGGEVKDWKPEQFISPRQAKHLDRFAQFAMVAAKQAVADSGITFASEDPFRCGVIIGSGIGGMNEFIDQHIRYRDAGPGRINPFTIPKQIANSASGTISIEFGLMGTNTAISTACSSAGHAISDAYHAIKWDLADVMVTGGSEAAITTMGLGSFIACKALSMRNDSPETASRPFDLDRHGFVLSEGAGIIVVEEYERARQRNAPIYAEILGIGNTADAFHITAPHEDGVGASRSMQMALKMAQLNPEDVDYINAHGTSTPLGDAAETKAIKNVFGAHAYKLAVSSTKSLLGHLLGASGGVEFIACALMIQNGAIHATINYSTPDPACDLDYVPNQPREARVRRALSNSFGFGGHNSTIVLGAV